VITTKFQFDTPNLQPLPSTTINAGRGCLVAHLSGLARITDNYIVFQVSVDGVPMQGHLSSVAGVATPAVFVSIDALSDFPSSVSCGASSSIESSAARGGACEYDPTEGAVL
jgi:hypothetical protein